MSTIEVILIDDSDQPIGKMEKLEAHQKGLLHRAVTIYVFNQQHELMLQQRATHKYHCGGQWSNTCCGHPSPGESSQDAAERRLEEEMGLRLPLHKLTEIRYNLEVTDGLIEHELGHIYIGYSDALPQLNPEEADDYRFSCLAATQAEMDRYPQRFTPWFRNSLPRLIKLLNDHLANQATN